MDDLDVAAECRHASERAPRGPVGMWCVAVASQVVYVILAQTRVRRLFGAA